jgi:hypothetical protein
MAPEWFYLLICAVALSLTGTILFASLWLKKFRDAFSASLTEMAGHQIRTAQRISESIAELQKQQDCTTRQIHTLAQEGLRLQREISAVSSRLDNADEEPVSRNKQTLLH